MRSDKDYILHPLELITFNHFFMESKYKIKPEAYKMLNPDFMQFFKCGKVYIATSKNGDSLEVNALAGDNTGNDFLTVLVNEARKANFKYITFGVLDNDDKLKGIAKHVGAEEVKITENYMSLNINLIHYKLDLITPNERFK